MPPEVASAVPQVHLPAVTFIPPYPPRPSEPLSVFEMLRRGRKNFLAIWSDRAFEMDLMSVQVLSRKVFICNSPDTVRHAFVTANPHFERKSPQMRSALKPLLGDGLFISDGETWRQRRRIVAPIIHGSRMPDFTPIMVEAAGQVADRWAGLAQIDALEEMAHLTAEIICRTIFGRQLGHARAAEIVDAFSTYQRHVGQLGLLSMLRLPDWIPRPHGPSVHRAARRIATVLDEIIATYQPHADDPEASVIARLLDATDDKGEKLSREALRHEAAVIFMAGHETTANCLAWTFFLLSRSPSAEARLHAELASVLGGRPPTLADLENLVFTRAIIEESLRLYPPVPLLAREAGAAEELRRRPVPAGSLVIVVPWLLHRHRKYWENPDHFIPDRFLPTATPPEKFVYVPFSIGPRVCAGMTFGLTEAILCLATLAQRFRLQLKPDAVIEPVCRLTLRPANGVPMTLHGRR
jgi:cytochrome P450